MNVWRIFNRRLRFGIPLFFLAQGLLTALCPAWANPQSQSGGEAKPASVQKKTIEVPFKSYDGYEMFGKLTLPDASGRHPVVIYVQAAEGMTVDMKRPNGRGGTFNYFDLYREKLPEMNAGFFSYEGRGIRMGDKPVRYEEIDWDIYNTSSLENKVRDCVSAVEAVRKQPGVDASRIFLMGASEGTLLACETASRLPKQIKGLVLYGVLSGNLKEAYRFIVTGGAFLAYKGLFDTDKDGKVSKAEFEADPNKFRERQLKNAPFEALDRTADGFFTVEDMKVLAKLYLDAADTDNYEVLNGWLKVAAAVSTPKDWFKDHFAHPPIQTYLVRLDIPIGCFQGDKDASTSIEGVKRLEEWAKQNKKSKMQFYYFEGLDHSLNIGSYFINGKMPAGHQAIFEFIKNQIATK